MTASERYNEAFELDEKRELAMMQGGYDDFLIGGIDLGPGDVLRIVQHKGYVEVSE